MHSFRPSAGPCGKGEHNAMDENYRYIRSYAESRNLGCTAAALPAVQNIMANAADLPQSRFHSAHVHIGYFQHALAVCRMLIDLRLPLERREEDILLSAAICHVLPETICYNDLEGEIGAVVLLHPEIYSIVRLLFREDNLSDAQQKLFFESVRRNKLALLIKLADRGNLVQQLYGVSSWSARQYIYETKTYFFPMCIYAKEHYPELLAPVSVLMEKMRCLIQVGEILLSRYEATETALSQEILHLQEENATLKGIIKGLQD